MNVYIKRNQKEGCRKEDKRQSVEVRISVLGLETEPPYKALGGGTEDKLTCCFLCLPNPNLELRAEWVGSREICKGLG